MATITWTGKAGDNNFNNPANWSPAQVPGSADMVVISPAAAVAINVANDTVASLTTSKVVTLNVADNTSLTIGNGSTSATFSNAGILNINSGGDGTGLIFADTKVTLNGGGSVVLSDNGANYVEGNSAADTLNNVNNVIMGAGRLGNGQMGLINGTAGTIDATGGNALYLNTGANTAMNSGLIEATGSGGLVIQSAVDNGAGGHITAAGGNVSINNGSIAGGTLSASKGGGIFINNGTLDGTVNTVVNTTTVQVDDNTALTLLGTITNGGTLFVDSGGDGTALLIGPGGMTAGTVTLTGNGHVVLSDDGANRIEGTIGGDTLVNLNNTISGGGQIGAGSLTLVNDATIDATGGNALYINTGSTVINSGLIEDTGPGGLIIQTTIDSSSGGTILAAGGNVALQSTLSGGTVSNTGTGVVVVQNGTFDGAAHAITNLGQVSVADNTTLSIDGTIINSGTITLASGGDGTLLQVTSAKLTLMGGGTIATSDDGANYIYAATGTDVLNNIDNTIVAAGHFGNGQLSYVNEKAGIVDAAFGNTLYVNTNSFTNDGLVESTGAGGLILQTTISNGAVGRVSALGGNISLNGGDIAGGTLTTHNAGFYINNGTLDGSANALTNLGTVQVDDNNSLYLLGTIVNQGTITIASAGDGTVLNIDSGTVTLTGGGTVNTSDTGANDIYGASGANVLDNINNTIDAAGQFGDGQLVYINESGGILDATLNNALVVNTDAFTNKGLVEATGTGGLVIETVISNGTVGVISAAGGNVSINSGTIAGGTLTASKGGAFYVANGTLDGSTNIVKNLATVHVDDNETLNLQGAISNSGTININSAGDGTVLRINSGTVTLTGGGVVNTTDTSANQIYGTSATDLLDNVDNTITGAGQFGAGQLTVLNEAGGTIDGSLNNALVINTTAFTNDGLVEATGAGGVVLQTTITNGSGGIVSAAGGNVAINGGTIAGGTLTSSGTGVFTVANGVLDGSAHLLTNKASVFVDDNETLYLRGAIANQGTITVDSGGDGTVLRIDSGTVTLTGNGTITTSDTGANAIYGTSASDVLDNVSNTIEGAGQLGDGQLTLINGGTIAATDNNALVINLGSTGLNTSSGQMLGEGPGGLVFQNGTYTNDGLIQADSGSSVTFQSGATLTNLSATGTLTGGSYGAISAGGTFTATTSITGTAVTTDDANIILSGAGSEIFFGGVAIETSLKTIGKSGELQVLGKRDYTTKNKLSNSGTVALGGGTLKAGGLDDKAGSLLTGFGTVDAKLTDDGSIVAMGGQLTLSKTDSIAGTISGTGTLGISGTTTLNSGTVLDVSHIALLNKATLNIATNVSYAGTFDITGTAGVVGAGMLTNTGLFEATSQGVGTISDPFANSGTISVAAGDSLAFSDGLANTGLILDSGTFTDTAALTGGSLTLGATGTAATIASGAGAGPSTLATLTTAGGALNTSGTTLTVTGDYNNTAAGTGNSYTPFAGVTGTIHGQGTQLAVVGVNGTTISNVHGTLTITVAPGGMAQFEVENTGAAGSAALRGALQTTVNGGHITGTALSGSGVTAGNFGPIAAGSTSSIYTIDYSSGALNNESIHLASDFANVAGLTIDIVAGKAEAAVGAPAAFATIHQAMEHGAFAWLPALHNG